MERIVARLKKIQDRISVLKTQNGQLQSDLKQAEDTIARLRQLMEIQNNTIRQQEQELKIKRLADQLESGEPLTPNESRSLKYKINEIIKEVDKVMGLIHQ